MKRIQSMENENDKNLEEEKAVEQMNDRIDELISTAERQFSQYIKCEQDPIEIAQIGLFIIVNRLYQKIDPD